MTGLPYSCQPMDLWIETTMNLNSKLKQGFNTRDANNVARVKAIVDQNVNCHNCHCQHVECQAGQMKKDEQAVNDILTCIDAFDAQPFDAFFTWPKITPVWLVASTELSDGLRIALIDSKS